MQRVLRRKRSTLIRLAEAPAVSIEGISSSTNIRSEAGEYYYYRRARCESSYAVIDIVGPAPLTRIGKHPNVPISVPRMSLRRGYGALSLLVGAHSGNHTQMLRMRP